MRRVAVYCGSSFGDSTDFAKAAGEMGRLIADQRLSLVYGGAAVGLMGAVADSYLSAGGRELIGVVPEQFSRLAHPSLSELHVSPTMHGRKQLMFELADAFVVLPGGIGTLDEMVEILEWARLGMHGKPLGLLNTANYYDDLLRFLDHVAARGFCTTTDRNRIVTGTDPTLLLAALRDFQAPEVERWWTTVEAGAPTPASLAPFDPNDEATLVDPYPVYARYRRHAPVHWGAPYSPGAEGCWYLFRHRDVVDLLRDRRFRRRWPEGGTPHRNVPAEQRPFWDVFDRLLLSTDPPDHRRLRTLVSHAFTPQRAESYRPFAESVAAELVSGLPGDFDLVEDYAAQLSFTVICAILGVPTEDSRMVREWITQFGAGFDLRKGERAMREASEAAGGLVEYFGALVTRRRTDPADDLVTALINARHESNRLSHDELLAMCVQLVFAGHETTTTQIAATTANLLRNPDQLRLVRADPALIPSAVHESLRFEGSVQTAAARKPVEDVVLGDVTIRAGEPVIAFIGAANRDPDVFPDPDRFDVRRDNTNAVAFGAGIHYCLGAQLAKVETEAGVAALLRHRPALQVDTETPPEYGENIVLPGLRLLRVKDRF